MWIGLVLPYMLGLDVISFSISMCLFFFFFFFFFLFIGFQQKKKMGIRCRIFILSFDSFSDIACVFA
jgi:restriction endonuclease S subunit